MSWIFDQIGTGWEGLKGVFTDLIIWILNFLPQSEGIPESARTGILEAWGWALSLDWLLPISGLALIVGVWASFEISLLIFKFLAWLAGLIRGGS